ncbi:hypothetical protein, partial [Phaeodactylibacter xiamenensis]|uniref:hypothetical protein n=1 Tax=Phaeodactylibacter xiamenensis TaxID=1524460 RepID=UPI0005C48175
DEKINFRNPGLRVARAVGCKPYRGEPPARPALRTSSPKGSYVRQCLGLIANPPCTQRSAADNTPLRYVLRLHVPVMGYRMRIGILWN